MFLLEQIIGADGTIQAMSLLVFLCLPVVLWYVLLRASGIIVAYCTPSSYYDQGAPLWKSLCTLKEETHYLFPTLTGRRPSHY